MCWIGLTIDWMSSELMILAMLALARMGLSRTYPFFSFPAVAPVPKIESNFWKAAWVQTKSLPKCPPGQSWRRLSLSTWQTSTPGMFLAALTTLTEALS